MRTVGCWYQTLGRPTMNLLSGFLGFRLSRPQAIVPETHSSAGDPETMRTQSGSPERTKSCRYNDSSSPAMWPFP